MVVAQKIVPNLWYDSQAEEVANFYVSLFENSRIGRTTRYGKAGFQIHGQPEGKLMTVEFELVGQKFIGLNGGPVFKFNPSVSFMVNIGPSEDKRARENLDRLWEKLSEGGKVLMPLQEYPFSKRYGWIQDRFGVSWQLILYNPVGGKRPLIVPSLMFVGAVAGKAEEAITFYFSVFKHSEPGITSRYSGGMEPDKEGTIMFSDFVIEWQWFAAMDSAGEHDFSFNEAVSFVVNCENQKEIDYYWDKLSAVPGAERCGWLKDKFGVSWQVVPTVLSEMLQDKNTGKVESVTNAFLAMKKLDIAELTKAYEKR